jgi:hypothetical protein
MLPPLVAEAIRCWKRWLPWRSPIFCGLKPNLGDISDCET